VKQLERQKWQYGFRSTDARRDPPIQESGEKKGLGEGNNGVVAYQGGGGSSLPRTPGLE